jgi:dTMP kinase
VFISFEGIDGSGKTTQAVRLAERLGADGRRVVSVREPGGTPLGEQIRALLLDPSGDVTPRAELLLFSAARAQLVERVIVPALAEGAVVVADRFFDSTTAYQGHGRGVLSPEAADAFHALVTGGLSPDLTLIVDVDLATARQRRATDADDRMEASNDAFYTRVREGYHALAALHPDRVAMVDGSRPEAIISDTIYALVAGRL